ncbi:gamma-glutamyl-gamma-aminobutyrate hydrolase family protein [bacterium]|nr:gamma-glutamyl-gamma-aminobutyrate hydrolase family protein [bacterium]
MNKRQPIIGITASWAPEKEGRPFFSDAAFDYLKCEYSEAIADAGAVPIIIPNLSPRNWDYLNTLIRNLDALFLSGGSDLAPDFFNQEKIQGAKCVIRRKRDEFEFELMRRWEMIRPQSPIMAICRGHQVLNAYYDGSLFQDFEACGIKTISQGHRTPEKKRTNHTIEVYPGTLLAEIIGAGIHEVNSSHHQGIDKLADGFIVSARADDGIIEAIEPRLRDRWLISVQWHPEAMGDVDSGRIFAAFVESCMT